MKIFALAVLALAVSTSASLADESRHAPPREGGAAASPASGVHRAAAVIGRDGQDTTLRCPTEDANIDYHNCVNASTRDPNAKVRQG